MSPSDNNQAGAIEEFASSLRYQDDFLNVDKNYSELRTIQIYSYECRLIIKIALNLLYTGNPTNGCADPEESWGWVYVPLLKNH